MTICLYSLTWAADKVSAAKMRESALIGVDGFRESWLGLDSETTGRFGWGYYVNLSCYAFSRIVMHLWFDKPF